MPNTIPIRNPLDNNFFFYDKNIEGSTVIIYERCHLWQCFIYILNNHKFKYVSLINKIIERHIFVS